MKKIIIWAAFIFVLSSMSCNDKEFLDILPKDSITADNLFLAPEGFENALNAIYATVRLERSTINGEAGGFHGEIGWITKGATDDYYSSRYAAVGYFFVQYQEFLNPNNAAINTIWNWCYQLINSCNIIIDRAGDESIAWRSTAQKDEIIAQARLIRAWAYRHLSYCWGDIPITLNESSGTSIKTDWERTPLKEVLGVIENDLLFAEEHLPLVHSVPGRLNKAVAQHYLAELYLRLGENSKAEEKARSAINNPNFKLVTKRFGVNASAPGVPFMDQFYQGNVFHNQGNTEVLWEFPNEFDVSGGGGNVMRRSWLIRYDVNQGVPISPIQGRGSDFHAVTNHAWSLYEEDDDRFSSFAVHRFVINNSGDTLFTEFKGKDDPERDPLWPSTAKWDDGDSRDLGRNEGYNDQPYLRLAETYLLMAEAQFNQNKLVEATETLNVIRRRSNASEIRTSDVSLNFILDERTRELLTEEHRRYTLLRLGLWQERTKAYNKQSFAFITERDVLLPIPQKVIDANLDRPFSQNPGY